MSTTLQFNFLGTKFWFPIFDGNRLGFSIYRRHYSAKNKKPKVRQFIGPGEKLALLSHEGDALFAWRKFIDDCIDSRSGEKQTGVNCSVFRNESRHRSSDMILEAMVFAWDKWPGTRLYTYVDAGKVKSENPGYCFIKAGWEKCGKTKNGLIVMEALPPTEKANADQLDRTESA